MSPALSYCTAGESHGKAVVATVFGVPAGMELDIEFINTQLRRRQGGYGRGGRMKIEKDAVDVLSGLRRGRTLGSPLTLVVANRDSSIDTREPLSEPRPGHADLAGAQKYLTHDARNILERASARETAARVAAGAVAGQFLSHFGIETVAFVVEIGGERADSVHPASCSELRRLRDASSVYAADPSAEDRMTAAIDQAREAGDTVGGVIEFAVYGAPPGLGSHVAADRRLDGRLAGALAAIPAMKGVEIGLGFEAARLQGSSVHDEIGCALDAAGPFGSFTRSTNRAGGIEGGMTTGQTVWGRVAMKPIPTLMKPLATVNLVSKEKTSAATERSDVCAVPAASVVVEAAVAFEMARAFLEKFAGDTMEEVERAYEYYCERLKELF